MKNEPHREVTQTKRVSELDIRAQLRANYMREQYGWEVYVYHDAERWICSANMPHADDTRDWWRVTFDEPKNA